MGFFTLPSRVFKTEYSGPYYLQTWAQACDTDKVITFINEGGKPCAFRCGDFLTPFVRVDAVINAIRCTTDDDSLVAYFSRCLPFEMYGNFVSSIGPAGVPGNSFVTGRTAFRLHAGKRSPLHIVESIYAGDSYEQTLLSYLAIATLLAVTAETGSARASCMRVLRSITSSEVQLGLLSGATAALSELALCDSTPPTAFFVTPLHLALAAGDSKVVDLLIDFYAAGCKANRNHLCFLSTARAQLSLVGNAVPLRYADASDAFDTSGHPAFTSGGVTIGELLALMKGPCTHSSERNCPKHPGGCDREWGAITQRLTALFGADALRPRPAHSCSLGSGQVFTFAGMTPYNPTKYTFTAPARGDTHSGSVEPGNLEQFSTVPGLTRQLVAAGAESAAHGVIDPTSPGQQVLEHWATLATAIGAAFHPALLVPRQSFAFVGTVLPPMLRDLHAAGAASLQLRGPDGGEASALHIVVGVITEHLIRFAACAAVGGGVIGAMAPHASPELSAAHCRVYRRTLLRYLRVLLATHAGFALVDESGDVTAAVAPLAGVSVSGPSDSVFTARLVPFIEQELQPGVTSGVDGYDPSWRSRREYWLRTARPDPELLAALVAQRGARSPAQAELLRSRGLAHQDVDLLAALPQPGHSPSSTESLRETSVSEVLKLAADAAAAARTVYAMAWTVGTTQATLVRRGLSTGLLPLNITPGLPAFLGAAAFAREGRETDGERGGLCGAQPWYGPPRTLREVAALHVASERVYWGENEWAAPEGMVDAVGSRSAEVCTSTETAVGLQPGLELYGLGAAFEHQRPSVVAMPETGGDRQLVCEIVHCVLRSVGL